ncbi:MAG: hypothetical protein EXR69_01290 [Myxococcales bacterium]|nr:hypothetical protein [Myxococcales bacterium]
MTRLLLAGLLGCVEAARPDIVAADSCPGAPVAEISRSQRDGIDLLEIELAGDGEFGLGLSSPDWEGESCHGPYSGTCAFFDGRTLALQTVDTTDEVVVGTSTWFTQDRFSAWAVYYGYDLGPRDTSGLGLGWAACVGSGYPDCCTRDSPATSRR